MHIVEIRGTAILDLHNRVVAGKLPVIVKANGQVESVSLEL